MTADRATVAAAAHQETSDHLEAAFAAAAETYLAAETVAAVAGSVVGSVDRHY